jgi:photosystem II stability/assembly factor-like uncharacterized protein
MPRRVPVIIVFIMISAFSQAQQVKILTSPKPVSLRGLSVVNDQIVWVCGSSGSVGLSTDGGKNWKWIQVPHYEKSDFRDIEAFSGQEAVIMGITEPAIILSTADGGNTWKTVFQDSSKSVFLDAMDFSGNHAALVGDPIGSKIFFAESADRGKSWKKNSPSGFEATAEGEAFFAASGSNIHHMQDGRWALVSGGKKSCIYFGRSRIPLLINQGGETTGANSIDFSPSDPNQAFIVGGDFKHDTVQSGNSLLIHFNPFIQTTTNTPPHGYRSCVVFINEKQLICCGTSGVDFSDDGGNNWKLISAQGFHVCRRSKSGNAVFLAGPKGSIAMLVP